MLDHAEILAVPIANPDGRQALEETGDYCWRGNDRGVDVNRNSDWNFGGAQWMRWGNWGLLVIMFGSAVMNLL